MEITACVLHSGFYAIPAIECVLVKQHFTAYKQTKVFLCHLCLHLVSYSSPSLLYKTLKGKADNVKLQVEL